MLRKLVAFLLTVAVAAGSFLMVQPVAEKTPGGFWLSVAERMGWLHEDLRGAPVFGQIIRRPTGNDALACPAGKCGAVAVDFVSPSFAMTASQLASRISAVALAEPRTIQTRPAAGEPAATGEDIRLEFQQASKLFRYPDIISVQVYTDGDSRSSAAIWSRSVVGRKDFGVNRARVERWLAAIGR